MQYLYSIPSLLAYTFVIGKSVIMVGQDPRVSMGDCNHEGRHPNDCPFEEFTGKWFKQYSDSNSGY